MTREPTCFTLAPACLQTELESCRTYDTVRVRTARTRRTENIGNGRRFEYPTLYDASRISRWRLLCDCDVAPRHSAKNRSGSVKHPHWPRVAGESEGDHCSDTSSETERDIRLSVTGQLWRRWIHIDVSACHGITAMHSRRRWMSTDEDTTLRASGTAVFGVTRLSFPSLAACRVATELQIRRFRRIFLCNSVI